VTVMAFLVCVPSELKRLGRKFDALTRCKASRTVAIRRWVDKWVHNFIRKGTGKGTRTMMNLRSGLPTSDRFLRRARAEARFRQRTYRTPLPTQRHNLRTHNTSGPILDLGSFLDLEVGDASQELGERDLYFQASQMRAHAAMYAASESRDPIYRRRRFETEIIERCVRWYWYVSCRLSYRDLVAMMGKRGLPNVASGSRLS
jgi:hypothetical protein